MRAEDITPEHMTELGYEAAFPGLYGKVLREDDGNIRFAIAIFRAEDRWFAGFDSFGEVPLSAHRYALRIRDELEGLGAIWTMIDVEKPHAEKWLRRIGFEHVEGEYWRLDLGVDWSNRRGGGIGPVSQRLSSTGQAEPGSG